MQNSTHITILLMLKIHLKNNWHLNFDVDGKQNLDLNPTGVIQVPGY